MENLKRSRITYGYTIHTPLRCALSPFLNISSSLYKLAYSIRHSLYKNHIFRVHRLPIPVVSVGSLYRGGNGKTPMVDFMAQWLADSGIKPLIFSRGDGEVNMLQRHLLRSGRIPSSFGVGANWVYIASLFPLHSGNYGVAVLHDGMQHWRLKRDLDILMVNGLTLWHDFQHLPLGPLREPLTELKQADAVVIHHADLDYLKNIESMIRGIKVSVPIFLTIMDPTYLFEVGNINAKIPLTALHEATILCVSAIGSAESFVQQIEMMGAHHVDRVDFSDHHKFHAWDIKLIRERLVELEFRSYSKPIVVVTEKDYYRGAAILMQLYPYKVLVLCSTLKVVPYRGATEDSFKKLIKDKLKLELPAAIYQGTQEINYT